MLVHLDLFSGIGGFAYALDQVTEDVEHVFCDNNAFCRAVIKKHWPESKIYEDIRLITNTKSQRRGETGSDSQRSQEWITSGVDVLTGGFPCQPFSQAGLRRGTDDERHLWPEMLRVIQLTKPTWVIAENVRGLLTINSGLVFEQVCLDLETNNYEVQAFIIPAVSVNAPHRRDRVWIIAHTKHKPEGDTEQRGFDQGTSTRITGSNKNVTNSKHNGGLRAEETKQDNCIQPKSQTRKELPVNEFARIRSLRPQETGWVIEGWSWDTNWLKVAAELCGVDDGLSARLDGLELSAAKHRTERIKALGNAIVPQVAIQIFKSIL